MTSWEYRRGYASQFGIDFSDDAGADRAQVHRRENWRRYAEQFGWEVERSPAGE